MAKYSSLRVVLPAVIGEELPIMFCLGDVIGEKFSERACAGHRISWRMGGLVCSAASIAAFHLYAHSWLEQVAPLKTFCC